MIDDNNVTHYRDYVIAPTTSREPGERFRYEQKADHYREPGATGYTFGYARTVEAAKKAIDEIEGKKVTELLKVPSVFIVNEPLRRNAETGAYERWLPMESTEAFGTVVKLTPDGSPPANVAAYLKMIDDGLAAWKDGDFLVLVGDQALLSYAAASIGFIIACLGEAADAKLRVLKWERRQESYAPLTLESA